MKRLCLIFVFLLMAMGVVLAEEEAFKIEGIHTYPNPYDEENHSEAGIRFSADEIKGNHDISVNIHIYDIRGELVTELSNRVPISSESDYSTVFENNGYTLLHWKVLVDTSGQPLDSGNYLYVLKAKEGSNEFNSNGSFSVVEFGHFLRRKFAYLLKEFEKAVESKSEDDTKRIREELETLFEDTVDKLKEK